MNPTELLRLVDSLHRDKNIDSELVFSAIESALATAVRKLRGEDADIVVVIDRDTGNINAVIDGEELDQAEIGRIGAQTAKQGGVARGFRLQTDALTNELHARLL